MNPLQQLRAAGQSVWLDYIRRQMITSGELRRLVDDDGLSGMTSNPTLFEKAIAGSSDYDEALRGILQATPQIPAIEMYERLALDDIRMVADALRPVYEREHGSDGFVSLEVPPNLAHDTQATIAEARRLFAALDRPNVMIKVPATPEGIPAIEALTAAGVNVNITLIFSLDQYEEVAQAFLRGVARLPDPRRIASVASFFVSRVDTKVDREIDKLGTDQARALRGTIAIANAKLAYRRFTELFHGAAFAPLASRGVRVQKPLWGSTGTKDPTYSDVKYIEALIGPETVDTVPPATLDAFRDHGHVRPTLEEGVDEAERRVLRDLPATGIDLRAITEELLREGVEAFEHSFEQLMQSLETKRQAMASDRVDRQTCVLGDLQPAVTARLDAWTRDHVGGRVWKKDPTVWGGSPATPELASRLGWLNLHEVAHDHTDDMRTLAQEARDEGVEDVVLLGMGGSSLAPEVFQRTFGNAPGFPRLTVLDSTHPMQVAAVRQQIDPRRTWFLVSSKSGTTLESLSFFKYFWAQVGEVATPPGRHFIAITDPGTPLEGLARSRGFRRIFPGPPDVGGRYAALTAFGLVPAALVGLDVDRLLDRAWTMAEACSFCVPESSNPGLALGAALGELARTGRDKVTFFTSPRLAAFPSWLEQLIAESTGKGGLGIVPVADEPLGEPGVYGHDRVFVLFDIDAHPYAAARTTVDRLQSQGHPVIRIQMSDAFDLGQEIFRWEFAVAGAGIVLRLNPFNQPDVELAKELARQAMRGPGTQEAPATIAAGAEADLQSAVRDWIGRAGPADYVALHAYLSVTDRTTALLEQLRVLIRDHLHVATTLGYGPRFLHSTGQLHKGGPDSGLFLQLVDEPVTDVPVPETDYTFGQLIRAQAIGDYQALAQRGRRVLRVQLGRQAEPGLKAVLAAVEGAIAAVSRR
jgi:transaldolase / glucose-6-phosphate isomerase